VKKYLLSLLLLAPLTSVIAQESNEKEEEQAAVEEVVVTGIRSSLKNAIDIKRKNVGVVDAITAEDIGKFPDGNLAESLSRIVGVAIDRSNVEGSKVAVRGLGPEFNLVTLMEDRCQLFLGHMVEVGLLISEIFHLTAYLLLRYINQPMQYYLLEELELPLIWLQQNLLRLAKQ
jgi:hypothetical protein